MKKKIREKSLRKRRSIKDKAVKSRLIQERLTKLEEWEKAVNVMLYISFGSEVCTQELIKLALEQGKTVLVPVTEGNDIKAVLINGESELKKSCLGVLEPLKREYFPRKDIDLVVAPGTCFDEKGNRLGYGGGYYDRFLKNLGKPVFALAFEEQIHEELPCEAHDQKVKKIVTEKRIIDCD